MAQCVLAQGFRRLFFLNGHGGNEIPAAQALTALSDESDAASVAHLALGSYWTVASDALNPSSLSMKQQQLSHACEYETSLMLFLRGDTVTMERAKDRKPAIESKWWHSEMGGKVRVFKRFAYLTENGGMGLPEQASPEKGSAILDAIMAEVVAFLRDFHSWPELPRMH